jgi:predicted membrane protein
MENTNDMQKNTTDHRAGKIWAGLFIIFVGSVLLLNNVGLNLPKWLFSWSTLLIVLGLFVGFKHRFKSSGWLIMVLIGSYFTLEKAIDIDFDFGRVTLPIALVTLGLFLIFKPKSSFESRTERWHRKGNKWKKKYGMPDEATSMGENEPFVAEEKKTGSEQDYINSINVFGGSHQRVYSKSFKGGEVTAVFGGCDINMAQADFVGEVEIDITAIFGGCKLIVPPGWSVKSEVTAIFGGVDDKRGIQQLADEPHKLLIIRGIAMFGGIDIRNF